MRAVALAEPGRVALVKRPEPELRAATDAVIRVRASGICGSDLHMFHGRVAGAAGATLGHEYVGEVVAAGNALTTVAVGDRVVGGFGTACGHCRACAAGRYQHCAHGSLFGLGAAAGALPGTQAELARIPHADLTLRRVPDGITDRDALFAGDGLATAAHALAEGGLRAGDDCAVIGLGPVGLCAVMLAVAQGAGRVLALDRIPARLAMAGSVGAVALDGRERDWAEHARALTGDGAAVVVEAVGSSRALAGACELAGPGATIAIAGMFAEPAAVPMGVVFAKGLRIVAGVANVLAHLDRVLALIACGRVAPGRLITHELALGEAPQAYEAFDRREALKVMLRP